MKTGETPKKRVQWTQGVRVTHHMLMDLCPKIIYTPARYPTQPEWNMTKDMGGADNIIPCGGFCRMEPKPKAGDQCHTFL